MLKIIKKIQILLINFKNAQFNKKLLVIEKNNLVYKPILNLLWNNGYILYYNIKYNNDGNNKLKIYLKYFNNKPVLKYTKIFICSKRNFNFSINQIYKLKSNSYYIFLTKHGLKSLIECQKANINGRLLLLIN